MLDESLCGYPDAVSAVKNGDGRHAERPALEVRRDLPLAPDHRPGCSGRAWAFSSAATRARRRSCPPPAGTSPAGSQGLSWVEGSYDRHILKANVTRDDITFGYGGWARPLAGPGLGIHVDPAALEAMTTERSEITYD